MKLFALQVMVADPRAVEGAEHFNGQAFYDKAVNYTIDRSAATRGFTPSKKYVTNDMLMLRRDAAKKPCR